MTDTTTLPLDDFVTYTEAQMQERAAAFHDMMRRRHTIRDFAPTPVPQSLIETCIATAGTAPSGANHQPWFFSLIGSPETKRRIREAAEAEERAFYEGAAGEEWLEALAPLGTDAEKPFLQIAPWLIAVFVQRRGGPRLGDDRKNYYINESVGIACGLLIAALHNAGLATLTHTPNPMTFLTKICNRPDTERPFILMVTGYPAEGATYPRHAALKKPLQHIMQVI